MGILFFRSPSFAEGVRGWVDSQKDNAQPIINYEFLAKGIFIFSIGLFKKVFIADSFAKWADKGFEVIEKGGGLNALESWATILAYIFQKYFDFSGYCDMAMGLALMFGIVLPINFNSPYKSTNIAEFWRRWHITLGRFLKHCVYIPLGGSKVSKILNLRNLFIVFFISGIWHGAGLGFVIWGSLHGFGIIVYKIYSWIYKRLNPTNIYTKFMRTKIYIILCWFITFVFINITQVFYRADSITGALSLLKGMFGGAISEIPHKYSKIFSTLQAGTNEILIWLACAFIVCLMCKNSVELMQNFTSSAIKFSISLRIKNRKFYIKCGGVFMKFIITLGLFFGGIWILCKNLLADNAYSPFVYFNF